jgi:hypothetical protein
MNDKSNEPENENENEEKKEPTSITGLVVDTIKSAIFEPHEMPGAAILTAEPLLAQTGSKILTDNLQNVQELVKTNLENKIAQNKNDIQQMNQPQSESTGTKDYEIMNISGTISMKKKLKGGKIKFTPDDMFF